MEPDPFDRIRRRAEKRLAQALYNFFFEQYQRVIRALEARRVELLAIQAQRQEAVAQKQAIDLKIDWDAEAMAMKVATRRALEETLQDAYKAIRGRYAGMNISVSWEVWDRAAADLARKYEFELIEYLNNSTKQQLGRAISEWIERGDEFPELVKEVRRIIPPVPTRGVQDRAQMIATTEVTRIFAEARVAGMQAAGLTRMRWRTAEDELVCPICGPLGEADNGRGALGSVTEKRFINPADGKAYGPPPLHPRCRCWIVEDTDELNQLLEAQSEAQPAVQPPPEPEPEGGRFPWRLEDLREIKGMHLGGAHQKKVYQAPDGSRWLFKPQDEFRAYGDKVAYDLAKAVGLPAAETYVIEIEGQIGSIQRMFDDVVQTLSSVDPASLTEDQLIMVQREHIFDWLIGNHDGHAENLLLLKDGRIVGIDKGQLFKFYDQDRLDWEYNPNRRFGVVSYHNRLLARWAAGEDVTYLHPLETDALREFIERIQALDDETLKQIVRPYAERAVQFQVGRGQVALAYQDVDRFLEAVVERKRRIADDFLDLYERALKARNKALGITEALTPLTEEFVQDIVDSGWQGKAILLADDGIENMSALAYKVDGDGTFLEMKLTREGDRRFLEALRELGLEATGSDALDPYWEEVLTVAKSYNYHLDPNSPGYDGVLPPHTKQKIGELYKKLGHAALQEDLAAKHYYSYIAELAQEILGGKELGGMVGVRVKQFEGVAPKRRRDRPYTTKMDRVRLPSVRHRHGRIELTDEPGRQLPGQAIRIEFDKQTRAEYIAYNSTENGRIYSKQGLLRVQIDGDPTPEKINRALDHLRELGLDVRPATKEDIELMYLKKMAWVHKLDEEVESLLAGLTREEQLKALRRFWSERLGVDDVTKLPGYNPMPTYFEASPVLGRRGEYGWPRWYRFDLTPEDLEREMGDYYLVHKFTTGEPEDVLPIILEHNGYMISTEEKARVGVPIRGMSPIDDMASGGAEFVFLRIKPESRAKSTVYHLVFDKRLLLDMDVIAYDDDYYGRTTGDFIRTHRMISIDKWKWAADRREYNEVIVKRNMPLLQYLEYVNAYNERHRERLIRIFKRYGIHEVRGRPIEEVVRAPS